MPIIEHILTREQEAAGFYLRDDEDFVYLCQKSKSEPIVRYSAWGAVVKQIREDADLAMAGIKFEKVKP